LTLQLLYHDLRNRCLPNVPLLHVTPIDPSKANLEFQLGLNTKLNNEAPQMKLDGVALRQSS